MVLLLSGGIDSPVAGYLMLRQGVELLALHMDNGPFTDHRTLAKVVDTLSQLQKYGQIKLYIMEHHEAQTAIARGAPRRLQCVLCRRQMYRAASRFAKMMDACCIVTGESMGQVASQTLHNLLVESPAASVPVVRPLIGLDKEDIRALAEGAGTYEISIRPGMCCTLAPDRPATRAAAVQVARAESVIDLEALELRWREWHAG